MPAEPLKAVKPTYWFPAKRYGWGWGLPCAWQGWAVLASFAGLLAGGAALLLPLGHLPFLAYAVTLCLILMGVCSLTGEPPRWRRGGK